MLSDIIALGRLRAGDPGTLAALVAVGGWPVVSYVEGARAGNDIAEAVVLAFVTFRRRAVDAGGRAADLDRILLESVRDAVDEVRGDAPAAGEARAAEDAFARASPRPLSPRLATRVLRALVEAAPVKGEPAAVLASAERSYAEAYEAADPAPPVAGEEQLAPASPLLLRAIEDSLMAEARGAPEPPPAAPVPPAAPAPPARRRAGRRAARRSAGGPEPPRADAPEPRAEDARASRAAEPPAEGGPAPKPPAEDARRPRPPSAAEPGPEEAQVPWAPEPPTASAPEPRSPRAQESPEAGRVPRSAREPESPEAGRVPRSAERPPERAEEPSRSAKPPPPAGAQASPERARARRSAGAQPPRRTTKQPKGAKEPRSAGGKRSRSRRTRRSPSAREAPPGRTPPSVPPALLPVHARVQRLPLVGRAALGGAVLLLLLLLVTLLAGGDESPRGTALESPTTTVTVGAPESARPLVRGRPRAPITASGARFEIVPITEAAWARRIRERPLREGDRWATVAVRARSLTRDGLPLGGLDYRLRTRSHLVIGPRVVELTDPRDALRDGRLPTGAQASVHLGFEVPQEAGELAFAFEPGGLEGGPTVVVPLGG